LVAETTGGRRNRIDTLLVCRVPEPSEDAGDRLEPPSLGATRDDHPAGVVEG
jgi:hypothetical protein